MTDQRDLICEFIDNDGKRRAWRLPIWNETIDFEVRILVRARDNHHADVPLARLEWYTVSREYT